MATYEPSPTPYVYLMLEINALDTDENLLREYITLETWDDLDPRVERSVQWYGREQRCCIRWYAHSGNGGHDLQHREGEWGYEGDDWAVHGTPRQGRVGRT